MAPAPTTTSYKYDLSGNRTTSTTSLGTNDDSQEENRLRNPNKLMNPTRRYNTQTKPNTNTNTKSASTSTANKTAISTAMNKMKKKALFDLSGGTTTNTKSSTTAAPRSPNRMSNNSNTHTRSPNRMNNNPYPYFNNNSGHSSRSNLGTSDGDNDDDDDANEYFNRSKNDYNNNDDDDDDDDDDYTDYDESYVESLDETSPSAEEAHIHAIALMNANLKRQQQNQNKRDNSAEIQKVQELYCSRVEFNTDQSSVVLSEIHSLSDDENHGLHVGSSLGRRENDDDISFSDDDNNHDDDDREGGNHHNDTNGSMSSSEGRGLYFIGPNAGRNGGGGDTENENNGVRTSEQTPMIHNDHDDGNGSDDNGDGDGNNEDSNNGRTLINLEEDIYTFFFVSPFLSWGFLYATFFFALQLTILILIFIGLLRDGKRGNPLSIPLHIDNEVLVAQVLALIVTVCTAKNIIHALDIFQIKYDKDVVKSIFPHATKLWWWITDLMRFSEGALAIVVTFLFIVRSTEVLDLFLNFAAVQFVGELDGIGFIFAQKGMYSIYLYLCIRFCLYFVLINIYELPTFISTIFFSFLFYGIYI